MAGSAIPALPPVSDAELEAANAQGVVVLHIGAPATPSGLAPVRFETAKLARVFGIQNLVAESGTASLSQATTSLALTARLNH